MMSKTIIAGSRSIDDLSLVQKAVDESGFDIDLVISGTAKGVDKLGEIWAEHHNIPILRKPADWKKYGKSAGFLRNQEMARLADNCILIWDMKSKGTKNMIECMIKMNKPYFVFSV